MIDNESFWKYLISRRTFLLTSGKFGILSLLLSRMFYMQILKGSDYKIKSEKNRISLILIPPQRGDILDRNGEIVATNKAIFSVKLDRRQSNRYKDSIEKIFEMQNFDDDSKKEIFRKLRITSRKIPLTLINDISWNDLAKIEEKIPELEGIYTEKSFARYYKFPEIFAHVTGYIGKISSDQISNNPNVPINHYNGKSAVEKFYETKLAGKFGYKKVETNARGLFVNELESFDSVEGDNLSLTIDRKLQEYIHKLLPSEGSSAVIMDINDGSIMALNSKPSYDVNEFIGGISHKSWNALLDNPYKPLLSKVTQTHYPPGSTFKLITILSALESGISPDFEIYCMGSTIVGNQKFHCWKHTGHGRVDMSNAIKQSCNCYMYEIAKIVGASQILNTAKNLGYGSKTGIDLSGEVDGFLPSREWKLARFKFDWSIGDTLNISIGQGALLSTPLQQAVMVAAFANNGKILTPRVNKNLTPNIRESFVESKNLEFLRNAMYRSVNEYGGTSYRSRSKNVLLAGKTGTSQVRKKKNIKEDLNKSNIIWNNRNHALFAGFFPYNKPKYAMSIIIDHGGGGSAVAAPIARKIAEYMS